MCSSLPGLVYDRLAVVGRSDVATSKIIDRLASSRFKPQWGNQKEEPTTRVGFSFCAHSTKMQLVKSRRSRVWNPQLVSVWNQHEVLNVINPKEDTRWRVMPYAFGDYILTCGEITCQSFGLDRKKTVRKRSFFLAPPAGLEPATSWLTVMRSTDWAKEEYVLAHIPP